MKEIAAGLQSLLRKCAAHVMACQEDVEGLVRGIAESPLDMLKELDAFSQLARQKEPSEFLQVRFPLLRYLSVRSVAWSVICVWQFIHACMSGMFAVASPHSI